MSRYITFIDDNIGVDWNYCAELWEALIPERIVWMSRCSLHIADHPDLLALAHRSGCRLLSFGVESTSATSVEMIDKEWNRPDRYHDAVRTIRAQGIDVSTEMIIGLDGDDASVFERTYRFLMDSAISVPRIHILTPVPGTPLFEHLQAEGRILRTDFGPYSGGQVVFQPRGVSAAELQAGYWTLYERLFRWPAIWHRAVHNRAGLGAYMRAVVLAVNLHYRGHVWHNLNLGRIADQMPYSVLPVLVQPEVDENDSAPPIPFQPELDLTEGSHFGYALQWFTFAGILFFGDPFFLRKQEQA